MSEKLFRLFLSELTTICIQCRNGDCSGKLGMDGSKVWEAYQQGKLNEIRNYCETDVVNTYLVYARFQLMRGQFSKVRYEKECELVRNTLRKSDQPHWAEYLAAWPNTK